MKKLNLLALVASIILVFSSCSSNETLLPEEQSVDLLKTYTVKRDANGAYSLDIQLANGGEVEKVDRIDGNSTDFRLFAANGKSSKKVTKELTIEGTSLKVGFVDTEVNNSPQIILQDDNLKIARKNTKNKLKEYSISSNSDGTFTLDFNVANNVQVDFVYNQNIDTYEVHLENGKSNTSSFSKVLEKEDGKPLKLDFVNHISNASSRGELELAVRKPKVIIDTGERLY